MFTPQEVSEKTFPKSSSFSSGYDLAAVDEFLDTLTEDYTALYKENAALKAKLKVLAEKVEEYRSTEDAMRQTLLTAQKMADSIVHEAEAKRDEILAQAESSARASVEFELAMTEIARLENIRFTDAELEEKYTQMSALYGMTPEQLKQNLPIERLTHDLRLARARAIVVDSGKEI